MRHPDPALVPSESTVEQLANHQILSLISPYGAWFYVPTKREEKHLGYDASLQGHKALVIQYKRFRPSGIGGRVSLPSNQHHTLTSVFPPAPKPYVFYGFALHSNYAEIDTQFSGGFGQLFGARTIFIDAHSIPVGTKSLAAKYNPFLSITAKKAALRSRCLPTLVRDFQACNLGLRPEILLEPPFNEVTRSSGQIIPNLNVLWAHVSA